MAAAARVSRIAACACAAARRATDGATVHTVEVATGARCVAAACRCHARIRRLTAAARVSRIAARACAAARRAADASAVHAIEVAVAAIICAECACHASVSGAAHGSECAGRLAGC
jgi:hypothetical protein